VLPTVDDGQRAPALRWGDPRTMALFAALCAFSATPVGITNRSLRERVGALFDAGPKGYTQGRMTYDLRRLRLKGLLLRLPHSQRYVLTPLGRRVALFMSKSFARLVRPVLQRLDPALPDHPSDPLRRAWRACEQALDCAITEARCRRGLRREARPLTSDLGSRCHFRVARGLRYSATTHGAERSTAVPAR